MLKTFPTTSGDVVFAKKDYAYQRVLDDSTNTKFIGILTFNISPQKDSNLLQDLKTSCAKGTNVVIVTNITKRYPSYFGVKYEYPSKENINLYKKQLNPRSFSKELYYR